MSATISKSAAAPSGDLHVDLGNESFDLTNSQVEFSTDDPSVIANAQGNRLLTVTDTTPTPAAADVLVRDPNDPSFNPSADHLSAQASPEAVAAAAANQAAINAVVAPTAAQTDNPTVADVLAAQFAAYGVDTPVQVPSDPTPAPVATPPTATASPAAAADSTVTPTPAPVAATSTPTGASS